MKLQVERLLLPVAASAGCFFWTPGPATWDERYGEALKVLQAAKDDRARFYVLDEAAKASFEMGKSADAKLYAEEALKLAERWPDDWNYGNAIHDGHMVLGRVALRNGDVDSAKRELLLAGKTPGSPQLNSFGPNMSLAKDLLEQKHTDTVIEYFGSCGSFWKMERGNLRRWTVLAKGGEMPDFGANLLY